VAGKLADLGKNVAFLEVEHLVTLNVNRQIVMERAIKNKA
jgi:hypothetical protein